MSWHHGLGDWLLGEEDSPEPAGVIECPPMSDAERASRLERLDVGLSPAEADAEAAEYVRGLWRAVAAHYPEPKPKTAALSWEEWRKQTAALLAAQAERRR